MIRKLKFWALIAIAVVAFYAMIGFFVVPAVARSQAVSFLKKTYGLELSVEYLRFNPFTFVARLGKTSLDGGGERLVAFDGFSADLELRSLFDRAVVFKSIALQHPYVHLRLRQDGTLNLVEAFRGPPGPPAERQGDERPLAVTVEDFVLSGGDVQFSDDGRGFDQHFAPLELHVQHFSTRPQERSELDRLAVELGGTGRLTLSGDLSAIPASFDLRVAAEEIPLVEFKPYFADRLPADLSAGTLSFDVSLRHGQPGQAAGLIVQGQVAIADLAFRLRDRDDVMLSWKEVAASGVDLELAPGRLAVEEVAIKGLDTAFKIYSDGRTNLGEVVSQLAAARPADEAAGAKPPADAEEAVAFPYKIDRIAVADSRLLYSDELIRPHVTVDIQQLAGEVRDIGSAPETRTSIALAGRVGAYGKANITGAALLAAPKSDLDAKVDFDNVELTSFSPYAGKFAGYTIKKGKLFLGLRYTLVKGRIQGKNHALFDQFELGDKVDSSDATRLPVKFALSLLRDRQGRIDLELPVEGDADSPNFRLGPLIVKALVNLITKIVMSPFDFVASLVGGSPDMEHAEFVAGSDTLDPAEQGKILPLSKALAERPQLIVQIQGRADPAADGDALRQKKLDDLLATAAKTAPPAAALRTAYDGFFGAGAAEAVRKELAAQAAPAQPAPPAAKRKGATPPVAPVDPQAFDQALRSRLLAAQPVTHQDLIGLAYARGQRIMDLLVQQGGVEAERVFVRHGELGEEGKGTRAKLVLDTR